jgi:hypothetical protein
MINKLIIDGNNIELSESTKMPYTHTFQKAKTHDVKFGLDNTNEICAYAFKDCANLTKIEIPETITMLKRGAFMNCSNLPEITLNKNIDYIGNQCFDGCTNLAEIKFEGDATRNAPEVYCKIPAQTTIYVPDGSKYVQVDFDDIDVSGDIDYFTLTSWGQYLHVDDLSLITPDVNYYRNKWDNVADNTKIKENKNRRPVTKLSFSMPTFFSNVGKTETITVSVLPEDCTNLNLTWTTNDSTVLEIKKVDGDPKSVFVKMLKEDNTSQIILKCQAESGINASMSFFIRPAITE